MVTKKENLDIDNLDIVNKKLFGGFLDKREKWLSWFNDDPEHSLSAQIRNMLWDDAIFRANNEIRRIKINNEESSTGINADISHLIDRGYVNLQATSIRSLIDRGKDVISLLRIIKSLKGNHYLLTRENYVCNDGLKFNPEHNDEDIKAVICEHLHKTFDELSGVSEANRGRNDLISPKIFPKLINELIICNNVKVYTDSFIAHKMDSPKLKDLDDAQLGVTLDQISLCHKTIIQVANFIYGAILGEGDIGTMPTPQHNQFEDLDKPWVQSKDLSELHEFWNLHTREIEDTPSFMPQPSQKIFVDKFIDWEKVQSRLIRFQNIGKYYSLDALRGCSNTPPYYCHYLAWRLGTWAGDEFFIYFDELLEIGSAIENWETANQNLLLSCDYGDFWGFLWQLQIIKLFKDHPKINKVKWLNSGPDIEVFIDDESFFIECYTYRKSFGIKEYIDEIFSHICLYIKVDHISYSPFNLPKNGETAEFLDRLFSPFLDPQFIKEKKWEAEKEYPVLLPVPEGTKNFYLSMSGPGEYVAGRVPGKTGNPEQYLKVAVEEALNNKKDRNQLKDNHPNCLAVNFLLGNDFEIALNRNIELKQKIALPNIENIDSIFLTYCGIDKTPQFDRGIVQSMGEINVLSDLLTP
jgi:hypothetical protein